MLFFESRNKSIRGTLLASLPNAAELLHQSGAAPIRCWLDSCIVRRQQLRSCLLGCLFSLVVRITSRKSSMAKTVSFCVMLLPLVGAPLYCFLVYSRTEVFRKAASGASPKG